MEETDRTTRFRRWQTRFVRALAVWLLVTMTLVTLVTWTHPRLRATIGMAWGLIILWVGIGGTLMRRFRNPIRAAVLAVRLDWRVKFILFATLLILIEEAITTTMTNLAPWFGVRIGEAYITASTNYWDVIGLHSVVVIAPMFVAWALMLSRYDFSPFEVFLLFGMTGTLAECSFGLKHLGEFAMWIFIYGLMVYLPAYSLPAERKKLPPKWWHYPLAVVTPFVFIPIVPLPLVAGLLYPHHPSLHFPPITRVTYRILALSMNRRPVAASRQSAAENAVEDWRRSTESPLRKRKASRHFRPFAVLTWPMTTNQVSRRDALARTGLLVGGAFMGNELLASSTRAAEPRGRGTRPFLYCLNTATIRGQKVGIVKEIEVASQAGYDAIEPWVDGLEAFVKGGGNLQDLRKRITDSGLTVEGAIGFPEWVVNDEARRARGLERAKREMEMVAQIGGKRFACPPAGATDLPKLDLFDVAERYRGVLEAGKEIGLVPELELWGSSKNLNRLSECVAVAIETGHPDACVLVDVFHLYRGGSEPAGFRLLGPQAVQVMHMNDYPADPPREKIDDSYRVFPGDGTAPLADLLRNLHGTGGQKVLSLELFNRKYWAEDPLEVAKAGLAKMRAAAENALA